MDDYFRDGNAIMALNENISQILDNPAQKKIPKRKIVVAVPEPIPNQTDWGELSGRQLDFSKQTDRLDACKWFIDYVIESFQKANPK